MVEQLIPYSNGMQYDGSNGAAILAAIPAQQRTDYNIAILSEGGGMLLIGWEDAGPTSTSMQVGDWLVWTYGTPQRLTNEQVVDNYIKRSDLP